MSKYRTDTDRNNTVAVERFIFQILNHSLSRLLARLTVPAACGCGAEPVRLGEQDRPQCQECLEG